MRSGCAQVLTQMESCIFCLQDCDERATCGCKTAYLHGDCAEGFYGRSIYRPCSVCNKYPKHRQLERVRAVVEYVHRERDKHAKQAWLFRKKLRLFEDSWRPFTYLVLDAFRSGESATYDVRDGMVTVRNSVIKKEVFYVQINKDSVVVGLNYDCISVTLVVI